MKNLKNRIRQAEEVLSRFEIEEEPISKYSPDEQAILKKAEETVEKLKRLATPNDRFGTFQATKQDRENLVAAAEIARAHRLQKEALEVTK